MTTVALIVLFFRPKLKSFRTSKENSNITVYCLIVLVTSAVEANLAALVLQVRPLRRVPDQRNGSPRPRPVRAGHPGAVHRRCFTAGTAFRTGTGNPTEPHSRHSAAGRLTLHSRGVVALGYVLHSHSHTVDTQPSSLQAHTC